MLPPCCLYHCYLYICMLKSVQSVFYIHIFPIHFQKELAKVITLEQGKTLADAEGDVFRGLRE